MVSKPTYEELEQRVKDSEKQTVGRKQIEEALKTRLNYEKMLSQISTEAISVTDIDEFQDKCLNILGNTLDASRIYIFEHRHETDTMDNTFEWVANDIQPQIDTLKNLPSSTIPWWIEMMHNNQIINYKDIEDIPGDQEKDILREQNVKSILVVPLFIRGKYHGFIGFDECRYYRDWLHEDIQILKTVAQVIAQAIGNGQANERMKISNRFFEITGKHIEMAPMLEEFITKTGSFTKCAAVGIRILDDKGNIPYQAYKGFRKSFYQSESPLSIKSDQCMCINVVKGGTNLNQPFYTEGGSFYMNGTSRFLATVSEADKGSTRNTCNQAGYESVALVPIRLGNKILGLIHVADNSEYMVPLNMVEALEQVAMQLGATISRILAADELRVINEQLNAKTASLGESNIALKVLLERRDKDKTELEEKVLCNVKELIVPYLEKIKNSGLSDIQSTCADILESNLNDIVSPFLRTLSATYSSLTPREIQVASLIRQGKTNKEISDLVTLSIYTIAFHRKNIRRKLGLQNTKSNLRSYLMSLS